MSRGRVPGHQDGEAGHEKSAGLGRPNHTLSRGGGGDGGDGDRDRDGGDGDRDGGDGDRDRDGDRDGGGRGRTNPAAHPPT